MVAGKLPDEIAQENIRHQESLLFDRLNFFLAGSAFLITAYAALVVAVKHWSSSHSILLLTYLVNGAGFYLCLFFAVINYLNTKIIEADSSQIKDWQTKVHKCDETLEDSADMIRREVVENEFRSNPYRLILGPIKGFCKFLKEPFHLAVAPHTYILPLGISVFWLVVFFFVFPPHFLTLLFFLLPLILGFGILNVQGWQKAYLWVCDILGVICFAAIFITYKLNHDSVKTYQIGAAILAVWIIIASIWGWVEKDNPSNDKFCDMVKQLKSISKDLSSTQKKMSKSAIGNSQKKAVADVESAAATINDAKTKLESITTKPVNYTMKALETKATNFLKQNKSYENLKDHELKELAQLKARITKKRAENLIAAGELDFVAWRQAIKTIILEEKDEISHH